MDTYSVIKSLHVISIIAWMAGLLYLPRLFVYHCEVAPGSEASEKFKIMERRLLRAIMNPAMIASWIFGGYMIHGSGAMTEGWFHVKLLCVVLMTGMHMMMARYRRMFESDGNVKSQKFFRILNEGPTILMIVIVFMVIGRPF
ncbi:protoporphyrinogen oxidase HemJ [Thalassospira alkalitolerans]|uniref:Protoporphyrinogen IX oxidase n=1 Tax=Thalassospira alkalitolerans TaxID=1293890 RepID=A0A1Y2LFR8_9PROT|nr:protoporphyrinogen oxidase HemJ [Thalassospira alkalitolerans]OSQ50179.1 membrane protein [Thalassospira alkalitolerans]|tara:strand:+ start:313919 stop:314347 length:429 start_codon:yes stop_codon:yes gene_type:complete